MNHTSCTDEKVGGCHGSKALADETLNPLFSQTANWKNTFDRRKEDMVILVNNATRFTILIYGIKRNKFKNITNKMTAAIRNTPFAMNLNVELRLNKRTGYSETKERADYWPPELWKWEMKPKVIRW